MTTAMPLDPTTAATQQDALILIVEDEPRLASVLGDYLKAAGFRTEWIADGAQVLDAYTQRHHDLILLDLMNRDEINPNQPMR